MVGSIVVLVDEETRGCFVDNLRVRFVISTESRCAQMGDVGLDVGEFMEVVWAVEIAATLCCLATPRASGQSLLRELVNLITTLLYE